MQRDRHVPQRICFKRQFPIENPGTTLANKNILLMKVRVNKASWLIEPTEPASGFPNSFKWFQSYLVVAIGEIWNQPPPKRIGK